MSSSIHVFRSGCILLLLLCATVLPLRGQGRVQLPSGVAYEYLTTYTTTKLDSIMHDEIETYMHGSTMPLDSLRPGFLSPKHAVRLYRVWYPTLVPEMDSLATVETGLVAVPETGQSSLPMVSYQHGTVFGKYEVPSHPDSTTEVKIMLAQFGGQGYVVIGADYVGLGLSDLSNSYFVLRTTVQTTVDMLRAAREVLASLGVTPSHLFLHGWSQGGWTNMQFLRALEETGERVTAAGSASAPVDLFSSLNRWMNNTQVQFAFWLPAAATNLIWAWDAYVLPGVAAEAIRPDYLEITRKFARFEVGYEEYLKNVPIVVQEVLRPEFMATGFTGRTPFWRYAEDGQAYRWRITTPLRVFYGGSDEVVAPGMGPLVQSTQELYGNGSAIAVPAGASADHRATYLFSTGYLKSWFDSFLGVTGVDGAASAAAALSLDMPYPQPATSDAMVTLRTSGRQALTVQLVGIDGRVVRTMSAGQSYEAGAHVLAVQRDGLRAGVYFLVVQGGGTRVVRPVAFVQ
jgi:hypothetical protein